MRARALGTIALSALACAGCGGGSSSHSTAGTTASATSHAATRAHPPRAAARLVAVRTLASLPEARSGIAATTFGGDIVVSGGLSPAGVSTSSVFRVTPDGAATTAATLPGPIHDAAAATLAGRVLVLGGGPSEGSDRIVSVLPGTPHLIGTLPQALSDLDAVTIGDRAYVVGGWNGTATNRDIYAVSADGHVSTVGHLPVGVRYPAAAALGPRVIVAGGELTSGSPTNETWSFDPATGTVTSLPSLPAPTDHTEGVALGGRFYLLGGLREGSFTSSILSWAPGETHWRAAGHLPHAIADAAAVPFAGGVALIAGRDSVGKLTSVTLLQPR